MDTFLLSNYIWIERNIFYSDVILVSNTFELRNKENLDFILCFLFLHFPPFFCRMWQVAVVQIQNQFCPITWRFVGFAHLFSELKTAQRRKRKLSLLNVLATESKICLQGYRLLRMSVATDCDIVSRFSASVNHSTFVTSCVFKASGLLTPEVKI